MSRYLFENVQAAMWHGRSKGDSFSWRWIIYPICIFIFMLYWLRYDPKSLYKHLTTKAPPPKPQKIIPLKDMPSTLTNLEQEHTEESEFVLEYIPDCTRSKTI